MSGLHKAFDYTTHKIIQPLYQDLVRDPLHTIEAVPTQALTAVDKTVGLFGNPVFTIGAVVVAVAILRR
jgi:hypothetical protein